MLVPGGRFYLFLTHPLLQAPGSGWVDDVALGEQYWRVGSYFRDDLAVDEVAPGVRFQFAHRPLSRYVHTMGEAGLLIDDMVEPPPPPSVLQQTGPFPERADHSAPAAAACPPRRHPDGTGCAGQIGTGAGWMPHPVFTM